ncbi:MAG: hypothetical protein ABR547_09750 [Halanaerobium sp.]
MKLSRKLLVMALVLAFVFGAVNMVVANSHTTGPWYVNTGNYFGNVPYNLGLNAEILQQGNNDFATIDQDGVNFAHIGQGVDYQFAPPATGPSSGNAAMIDQTGWYGEAEVNQRGSDNLADIKQHKGSNNYAGVGQNGDLMVADIKQMMATDSFVRASQFGGEGSEVSIMQFGDLNRIRTTQQGDYHYGRVMQKNNSYFNYASLDQRGSDQTAYIYQKGEENGALVEQAGSDNWAKVDQDGDHNAATVDQNNAFGLSALIDQNGNDNTAAITQTGGGL